MRDYHDDLSENRDDIPLKESGSDESADDEEHDYPSMAKFLPLLIGLCFQSFCIALVGCPRQVVSTFSAVLFI